MLELTGYFTDFKQVQFSHHKQCISTLQKTLDNVFCGSEASQGLKK